jgi:hypothetical protein
MVRAMQLKLRDENLKDAAAKVMAWRLRNKEYWDSTKEIHTGAFEKGEPVLL